MPKIVRHRESNYLEFKWIQCFTVLCLENSQWRNQMPSCYQGNLATPLESRCSGSRTTNEIFVEIECFTDDA